MKTLAELEAEIFEIEATEALPKLTEPSFGSFGSGIAAELSKLDSIRQPLRLVTRLDCIDANAWPKIIYDARWLLESGKAAEAIASGWSVMELFGWSASSWQSICVWLRGCRSLMFGQAVDGMVHTKWACARNCKGRRWLIRNVNAQPPNDGKILWDLKLLSTE